MFVQLLEDGDVKLFSVPDSSHPHSFTFGTKKYPLLFSSPTFGDCDHFTLNLYFHLVGTPKLGSFDKTFVPSSLV